MSAFFRAIQLRQLNRPEEAVALFIEHLAQFPEDAEGHAQLALTRLDMAGERRKALESIDSAIGLDADAPEYFAYRSLILIQLDRDKEAMKAAEAAIAMDPELVIGWLAKTIAASSVGKWDEAERAARHTLELDPDNTDAQNQLSLILRSQGKLEAADQGTKKRLERDPEDPMAHSNAGWAALQRRDVKKAEEHFREALRLEPESEYARSGLLESFKARSSFYRLFLRWVFFLQQFSNRQRVWILISIYFVFRFFQKAMAHVHPAAVAIVVTAYLLLVFSSFLASGISHFLLLKDRTARLALTLREKLDGLFVGGGFLLGFVTVIGGLCVVSVPFGVVIMGGALMVAAVPGAMFWTNKSARGRLLFGAVSAFVYVTGIVCLVQDFASGQALAAPGGNMVMVAVISAALCTWLSMVPSLHRGSSE